MERAFAGPRLLADRLGVDTLSAADLAAADPEELVHVFRGPPAVHRYPGSMAARTQEVCRLLVDRYGGRADALWRRPRRRHPAGADRWAARLRGAEGGDPGRPAQQAVRRHAAGLARGRRCVRR
jgi:uncharacterized HhH-GPD family protein